MSVYFIYNNTIKDFNPSYLNDDHHVLEPTQIGSDTVLRAHSLKIKPGNQVLARDVMKKNVKVLNIENTLKDAFELFDKYNFHHLPIVENTKLSGLISSNDLRNINDLENKPVKDYYSKLIIAVSQNTPLSTLFSIFVREEIQCLPVIDESAGLEGIITQKDLLAWVLKNKKYMK